MAVDPFAAIKARRAQLEYGEQRKIEALEAIADALLDMRIDLARITRAVAIMSRNASSDRSVR